MHVTSSLHSCDSLQTHTLYAVRVLITIYPQRCTFVLTQKCIHIHARSHSCTHTCTPDAQVYLNSLLHCLCLCAGVQVYELSELAERFLHACFCSHDVDGDGLITWQQLDAMFSTIPPPMWQVCVLRHMCTHGCACMCAHVCACMYVDACRVVLGASVKVVSLSPLAEALCLIQVALLYTAWCSAAALGCLSDARCVCACVCVCVCAHDRVHTNTSTHKRTYMCTCAKVHAQTHIHAQVAKCGCTRMHVCRERNGHGCWCQAFMAQPTTWRHSC